MTATERVTRNIAKLVKENGTPCAELGKACEVTPRMIAYIIKGVKIPSILLTEQIADFYGIDITELFKA